MRLPPGHNRYRILLEHPEIDYETLDKDFPDRFAASAWICKNQLGRRNLTPEQRIYLIGKQYSAMKESRGGERSNSDKHGPDGRFTAKSQNETLRSDESAGTRIAQDNNVARSTVLRAEQYAKGVDAADEALPGIRRELLAGSIKPTRDAVAAIARAAPEDRAGLAEQLRQPRSKSEKTEEPDEFDDEDFEESKPAVNTVPVRIPKKSEILALAESMNHSEGQAIGTVEDMIYEMNSAMQDMIFRWNFCKEAYAGPVRSRDGKRPSSEMRPRPSASGSITGRIKERSGSRASALPTLLSRSWDRNGTWKCFRSSWMPGAAHRILFAERTFRVSPLSWISIMMNLIQSVW